MIGMYQTNKSNRAQVYQNRPEKNVIKDSIKKRIAEVIMECREWANGVCIPSEYQNNIERANRQQNQWSSPWST